MSVETSGFVGRVLGDRWVVGEVLGSGTFGVVHAGVERGTGQSVAVKLLHPQFLHHGETIARFWNEAEALRRLDHPNVLTLLDVGTADDGVPYLVTELLVGETLRDLLEREGALPIDRALRLLGPAAHALHHAHQAGIVHRDLKPENIFRVRKDGMGTTKILDFGLAKLLDTQQGRKLSQTGIMLGTMAYSPPEQMQGVADIDHRADQFGFAAVMFEALTGKKPFPFAQPFQLFQAVLSGERTKPSSVRPDLPAAADDVLVRGLASDRTQRYDSIEAFYLALSAALTGAPLPNALPRPAEPERKVSARFRAVNDEPTRAEPQDLKATVESALPAAPRPTLVEGNVDLASGDIGTTLVTAKRPPPSELRAPQSSRPPPNVTLAGPEVRVPAANFVAGSPPSRSMEPEKPASAPLAPVAAAEPATRVPTWVWLVIIGLALAVIALVLLRGR
ncbi:MAG: protein kinase [Myxococcales bacterium]|nr:protein kinase [Myxococcales bacterium]